MFIDQMGRLVRLNFLGVRRWTGRRHFRLLMLAAGYVGLVDRCSETETRWGKRIVVRVGQVKSRFWTQATFIITGTFVLPSTRIFFCKTVTDSTTFCNYVTHALDNKCQVDVDLKKAFGSVEYLSL